MARKDTFTIRVSDSERAKLAVVAEHLRRSQSDALRELVHEKYATITASGAGGEGSSK